MACDLLHLGIRAALLFDETVAKGVPEWPYAPEI
jgi:hypothetical protein